MIKTLQKAGIEGTYHNIIKSYIWQTHSKHYPQWWKIERISPKVRNKTRVPTLTTTINIVLEVLATEIREKRNKRNTDWKRSKSLTVCRWHDPLHHVKSDQISRSVVSDSLWPHESQHTRPPCPSPTPRVHWDVHRVSDSIQPSHPLSFPSPLAPNPSQH